MGMIARLGVVLGLNTAEFTSGIAKADRAVTSFTKSVNRNKTLIVGAFAAMAVQAMSYADSLVDVADANDMTVDTVIKLQNALANSGGKASNATKIMSAFTTAIGNAAEGSMSAQKAFASAGVTLNDLATLSTEDLLKKTIDGFSNIEDTVLRNAKSAEIFSRAVKGVDLRGLNAGLSTSTELAKDEAQAIKDAAAAFDLMTQAGRDSSQFLAIELGSTLKAIFDYLNTDGQNAMKTFAQAINGAFSSIVIVISSTVLGAKIAFREIIALGGSAWDVVTGDIEGALERQKKSLEYATQEAIKQKALNDAIIAGLMGAPAASTPALSLVSQGSGSSQLREIISPLAEEISKRQAEFDLTLSQYRIEEKRMALLDKRGQLSTAEYNRMLEDLALQETLADIEKARTVELASQKDKTEAITQAIDAQANMSRLLAVKQSADRLAAISAVNKYELTEQAKLSQVAIDRSAKLFDLQRAGRLLREEDMQLQKDIFEIQADLADEITRINNMQLANADEQIAKARELAALRVSEANRQNRESTRGGTAKEGFMDSMTKAVNELPTAMENGAAMFEAMMGNMSNAMTDFVMNGKASFKDFARSIIADIMAIYVRSQILNLLQGALGGFGGFSSAGKSVMGSMPSMPGMAADGGYINAPTIVGENGPELFIPRTAGTVVPNQQMSGMGSTPQVVYNGPYIANMSAIDTQSATQFLAKNNQAVWAANAYANKSLAVTGGRT